MRKGWRLGIPFVSDQAVLLRFVLKEYSQLCNDIKEQINKNIYLFFIFMNQYILHQIDPDILFQVGVPFHQASVRERV